MHRDAHTQPGLVRRRRLACVAGLAIALGAPALAQETIPEAPLRQGVPSGRTFESLILPAPLQRADITLLGDVGWAWESGNVQRLLMEGEVRVTIGANRFVADRAACWFEPVQREDADGEEPLWQVAMYLENVSDPAADAAVARSARRLLVTAAISGEVRVRPAVFRDGRPEEEGAGAFVAQSELRLSRYLVSVLEGDAPPGPPGSPQIVERDRLEPLLTPERIDPASVLSPARQPAPIFSSDGVITFFGPDRTLVTGEQESALVITGGVIVQYSEPATGRSLELTAESAVVFLEPGSVREVLAFGPEDVRGIYLEGGVVATDGQYTIRGPRFFYDLGTNRGVALDAVFWTYGQERGVPLYLRADVIRQESRDQWSAGDATLANTSFFDPVFTIGASSVTLTRQERTEGADAVVADARDVTFRAADLPMFWIPRYRGQVTGRQLPRFRATTRNGDPILFSRYDIATLLGVDASAGFSADLLLDIYFERGLAPGLDLAWRREDFDASLFGTYINDDGTDQFSSGAETRRSNEDRGLIMGEVRQRIDEEWTLFAEGAYTSDPSFVDAFFPGMGRHRREFTNSLYLRRMNDQSMFSLEFRSPSNDFTPNQFLLQSRGFQVNRLPEARFSVVGRDLLDGLLSYTSESSVGAFSLDFTEPSAGEFGLDTVERSLAGLGILPGESPGSRLRDDGFDEDTVVRADTRHEVSLPLSAGPVRVEPFAVGRLTAYDDDFSEIRDDADDDTARAWAGGGVRLGTTIQRVNNGVSSDLFDLDRMRHIIEPSLTLFSAGSNFEVGDTPVFDERTDAVLSGTVFRLGLKNTWQTKRGAGDAERSVDWLTVDANYVDSSDDTPQRSPIGRFFESRPELTTGGEFGTLDAAMRLTDAVSLTTDWVFDFDQDRTSTYAVGALTDHGDAFSSFIEYRDVDPLDATFIHAGGAYDLTRRYTLTASAAWDANEENFQAVRAALLRRFNQLTAEFGIDFDDIRDDTSFSLTIRPIGARSNERERLLLNRDFDALDLRSAPQTSTGRIGGAGF